MWVSKNNFWNSKHTDLTKYFFEKIKQQVDFDEVISNRHKTSNGHTLVAEIVDVATMSLKRKKSFRRLASLINEAIDNNLSNNINNDYILKIYHPDIISYYKGIIHKVKDDPAIIKDIQLKSKVILSRLNDDYLKNVYFEIISTDFKGTNFLNESKRIDSITSCLIPSLLFKGYSPTSISDIAYRMIRKDFGLKSPEKFAKHFNDFEADYEFLLISKNESIELNEQLELFGQLGLYYGEINYKHLKKSLDEKIIQLQPNQIVFQISKRCIDPHNFLRSIYEKSMRFSVLSKNRESLAYFNDYFENIYWRFTKAPDHYFQPSNIQIDPINIKSRKNTLLETLNTLSKDLSFNFNNKLPYIPEIADSVYFYNLAIGSKSIENSMMLLWSSLEALIPYRFFNNDIENIQYFVSKSLSLGAIGRRVSSFANRLVLSSKFDDNLNFKNLGIHPSISYKVDSFTYWPFWLSDDSKINSNKDPFNTLKNTSNILCRQYCDLNMLFSGYKHVKKVNDLKKIIEVSKKSIEYQLDRIYLHRNQIVHSGKFINEYSNLWMHLEWYVGKLLSYCYTKYFNDEFKSKEQVFLELEADYDLIINLLNNHKTKKVKDIEFAYRKIFQHTWQFQ